MIPVSIVTGFLGSGKTTLISRILRDPAFGRTAVIVNEFGEIGLDHDLIASSDETLLELTTGCLCCAVQTDLARTLLELRARREAGTVSYDRVLIETSGLAEPAPILQALMTDATLSATHAVGAVVTLVDAVHADAVLDAHPAARHQVAVADWLLFSKTDVAAVSDTLARRIAELNPGARTGSTSQADAGLFFTGGEAAAMADRIADLPPVRSGHADGVESFVLRRDSPIPALALTMLLQALAEHCGARLLRMKGLVAIEEMQGQPAVVHGVRHVVSAPVFLDTWPSGDVATRIVFITQGVPGYFPARLLEAIEDEVRSELDRQR